MVKLRKEGTRLVISENEPVPPVKDFDTYINYLAENKPYLTKKKQLVTPKFLYQINQLMSNPNRENTPRTHQEFYPLLHLFFYLALYGKLSKRASQGSQKVRLEGTDRMEEYLNLTATEKHLFLLEIFWVDCDPIKLVSGQRAELTIWQVTSILEFIAKKAPEQTILIDQSNRTEILSLAMFENFLMLYLSFFGFFKLTRNERLYERYQTKKYFPIASLTPSTLGVTLAPILCKERALQNWNLPYRRNAERKVLSFPGLAANRQSEKRYVPFFEAFTKFFPDGELKKTLPRKVKELARGTFVLKVSVGKGIWRKIAISGEDTLKDFHVAIQFAFQFDFDHLYAFFMDGKRWSHDAINGPECDEGPYANDFRIGELELSVGQGFLYLFDFGDEWRFWVELKEIREDSRKLPEPEVIESKGAAPEQYPSYPGDWE